ncbi:hypothetical protein ACJX0J_021138 [Zea mays]
MGSVIPHFLWHRFSQDTIPFTTCIYKNLSEVINKGVILRAKKETSIIITPLGLLKLKGRVDCLLRDNSQQQAAGQKIVITGASIFIYDFNIFLSQRVLDPMLAKCEASFGLSAQVLGAQLG